MRAELVAAIRALRASATFTAVALLVLALGIGASTAIFSVVDAVVLRGLPFDEHDRLVAVGTRRPPPVERDPARDPEQLTSVSYVIGGMPLGGSMNTTYLSMAGREGRTNDNTVSQRRVTPAYHRALGIPLRKGRLFEPSDRQGAPLVLIVNESVVRRFFADRDPLGQSVKVADADRTIVGVVGDIHQTSLESRAFLFGLDPTDARAFAAALAALSFAAALASAIPARRAASVDPAEALRTN